ncbi:hypothetical protein [Citrobacter sp. Cb004]|uniref:hypothetical protein n=1 Tax=Citrobacter sp. Cb004 TaxID=2985006 RepID=UPI002576E88D|nr:hypothetical protein [Citrobacter sp. Cb004]MDM3357456.1 hypothetical protein [Citrobacter sp. Cb004]
MFGISKYFLNSNDGRGDIRRKIYRSCLTALLTVSVNCRKVIINSLFVSCLLSSWQVEAQSVKFESSTHKYNFSLFEPFQFSSKEQFNGVRDSIEFIKPIPGDRSLISIPQTNTEANDRPDESDKSGVGVEQQYKLTKEDSHKFWSLIFIQISIFLIVFPVGAYLSMRANIRNYWRIHNPDRRSLKVPALAMLSILSISRRIKSKRWQIWEQREWFRDMQIRHGLEVAYRDTWHWKKIIAEKW